MPFIGALIYVGGLAATIWITGTPTDFPLREQIQGITWLVMAIGVIWAFVVAFAAESLFWAAAAIGVVSASTYIAYARYGVVPEAWVPYVVPASLALTVGSIGALLAFGMYVALTRVPPAWMRGWLSFATFLGASGFAAYYAIRYFGLPPETWRHDGERAALIAAAVGAGLFMALGLFWPVRWLARATGVFMRTWFWAGAAVPALLANVVFDLGTIWKGVLNGVLATLLCVVAGLRFYKRAKDTYAQADTEDQRWKTVIVAPLASVLTIGLGGVLLVVGRDVPVRVAGGLEFLAVLCFMIAAGLILFGGWLATLVVAEGTSEVDRLRSPDRAPRPK